MNGQAPNHGWFKAVRSEEAFELIRHNRNAFVLLYAIASRARWRDGISVAGLCPGEAFIGDYKAIGLTEREYRTAKTVLENGGFATFKPTNRGTIATLCATSVFGIGVELSDGQNDGQATSSRRAGDGQTTTKEEWKEGKEGIEGKDSHSAAQRGGIWIRELDEDFPEWFEYACLYGNPLGGPIHPSWIDLYEDRYGWRPDEADDLPTS